MYINSGTLFAMPFDLNALEVGGALHDAINLMDLTSRAADLFKVQPAHEQQRFLRLVLKSGSWQAGELRTEFEEPFESLRRSNQLSRTKHMEVQMKQNTFEEWLPESESNLRPGG